MIDRKAHGSRRPDLPSESYEGTKERWMGDQGSARVAFKGWAPVAPVFSTQPPFCECSSRFEFQDGPPTVIFGGARAVPGFF